jgi:hypothetical protein
MSPPARAEPDWGGMTRRIGQGGDSVLWITLRDRLSPPVDPVGRAVRTMRWRDRNVALWAPRPAGCGMYVVETPAMSDGEPVSMVGVPANTWR